MSNFFVTLPSYKTKEFETNAAQSYQVRLPQRLPLEDGEWEVGLSAVSFPDAKLDLTDMVEKGEEKLFDIGWLNVISSAHSQHSTNIKLLDLEGHGNITDGVEFMKTVIDVIRNKVITSMTTGKSIHPDDYVKFIWEQSVGGQTVIIGNNGNTKKKSDGVYFGINKNLAINMGWLNKDNTLGPNLLWMAQQKNDGTLQRSTVTDFHLTIPFLLEGEWMYLSTLGNWRMTNLNNAFWKVVGTPSRIIYVYSNVGKSVIVGSQVTDLLREIAYKREGRGTVYFEPTHIQYHPVRNKDLEIISIQISETDGDLVKFGTGETIVTLHFRKQ